MRVWYIIGRRWKITFMVLTVIGLTGSLGSARTPPAIWTDQQLLELSRDTYNRQDWIYAGMHMNALIQRNPPLLRDNPAFADEVQQGLVFVIKRLQENQRLAGQYMDCAGRASAGVGVQSQPLSERPPKISWPQ